MKPARSPRSIRLGLSLAAVGLLAGACASSSQKSAPPTTLAATASAPTTAPGGAAKGSGPVDVLYAGSLLGLMEHSVGPAFHTATGYTFSGVSGDSGSLANEIKGGTQQADVFVSASAAKDKLLEGAAGGNWVSWYATFATTPLVLGYNPHSRFAAALRSEPWYKVITEPGFLLGRTDPATDPKGKLTVTALDEAASADNAPGLKAVAASDSNVFPENTLVGRLQAGQLDAGFFYGVEATAAHLATVPLSGLPSPLHASYTVTVVERAPHAAGAASFVSFLLGPAGRAALAADGLVVASPPQVTGTVPAALQGVLSGG